jgi:hypothetical protein
MTTLLEILPFDNLLAWFVQVLDPRGNRRRSACWRSGIPARDCGSGTPCCWPPFSCRSSSLDA